MAKSTDDQVRIEYVALRELTRWDRNPKLHYDEGIEKSIQLHGFVNPILLDEGSGKMVAGHGRLDALEKMRDAGADVPDRIVAQDDGDWLVPVLRGVEFKSEAEAERYLLADNQLTIAGGGWDDLKLGEILADLSKMDLDIDGLGWDDAALDELMEPFNVESVPPPTMKEGDREPFQQMTFTLHDSQVEAVNEAIAKAKKDPSTSTDVNENGNGNALARMAEAFIGQS